MPQAQSLERDIGHLRRLLDDAVKGIRAAEAAILHHSRPEARLTAINFPLEESLLHEAVSLLTDCKSLAAGLLRRLDAATASASLQFERLFDENAGRQSEGFLKRRVHLGPAAPEGIAGALVDLLSISATLDRMLKEAKPLLAACHRNCEAGLLQLVTRRQQIDADLEDVSHRLASLKAQMHERKAVSLSWRSPASAAAAEEERRSLAADRQAANARDERLRAEWETLQRMIADDEGFVEALNAGIAAANVMAAKLALDIEQRVALLKAADVQSTLPMKNVPPPVRVLIGDFEANVLAGHDLLARKQRIDDAFSRQLAAALPSPEESPEEVDGADASSAIASPPI